MFMDTLNEIKNFIYNVDYSAYKDTILNVFMSIQGFIPKDILHYIYSEQSLILSLLIVAIFMCFLIMRTWVCFFSLLLLLAFSAISFLKFQGMI